MCPWETALEEDQRGTWCWISCGGGNRCDQTRAHLGETEPRGAPPSPPFRHWPRAQGQGGGSKCNESCGSAVVLGAEGKRSDPRTTETAEGPRMMDDGDGRRAPTDAGVREGEATAGELRAPAQPPTWGEAAGAGRGRGRRCGVRISAAPRKPRSSPSARVRPALAPDAPLVENWPGGRFSAPRVFSRERRSRTA